MARKKNTEIQVRIGPQVSEPPEQAAEQTQPDYKGRAAWILGLGGELPDELKLKQIIEVLESDDSAKSMRARIVNLGYGAYGSRTYERLGEGIQAFLDGRK